VLGATASFVGVDGIDAEADAALVSFVPGLFVSLPLLVAVSGPCDDDGLNAWQQPEATTNSATTSPLLMVCYNIFY